MGAMRIGPAEHIVLAMRDALGAETFIETGTNNGNTSAWAAQHFKRVFTCEPELGMAAEATRRFKATPHVRVFPATSVQMLKELYEAKAIGTAVAWLDAHWCGPGTSRVSGECPLAAELAAFHSHGAAGNVAIIVDDARMFLRPPPAPHDPDMWPHMGLVCGLMNVLNLCVYEYQDTLVGIPYPHREVLRKAMQL